jgi:putative transcriptional regulator
MKKKENTEFFQRVEKGLQECLQWARGEISLRTTLVIAPPPAWKAKDIVRLRRKLNMSQGVFANVINVSAKTVQSWEQGERKPSQASLRLLQIIAENPQFVGRFASGPNGKKSAKPTAKSGA